MKSFSLIELIFVIVIIGILGFVGMQSIPNETPITDAEVLKKLILSKKTNALGYEVYGENNDTCLKITKDYINSEENSSRIKYRFKSTISITGLSNSDKLVCFDYFGRPYDGESEENLSNLLKKLVIITIKYHRREKNLTLYPISGYVE